MFYGDVYRYGGVPLDKTITFSRTMDYKQLLKRVEISDSATLLFDQDGFILCVSEVFLKVTGYRWDEIKHKSFADLITTPSLSDLHKDYLNVEGHSKVKWLDAKGASYQSTISIERGMDEDGHFIYILKLVDITSSSHYSLFQRFAHAMITDINFGVLVIDSQYKLVEISDKACEVLGVNRQEALNQPADQVFSWMPEEQRIIQKTLLDGVSLKNHAFSWTNNKQRYELIVDTNVLRDEQSKIVGAYVIFKDVTNTRSLEQQIQRHDRLAMIGQIAAGTAHEIRNPLTSIKGFLQVLRQTLKERGLTKETDFTEIMLTEIDRINSLVSEFLLLSKPRDIQIQLVDLASVWKELLPIIETEATLHNVIIENDIGHQVPMVIADRELLKQVFLNICKNGIEAMPDGGILRISCHNIIKQRKISIDIHDVGPGIPPYVIDKIFDPFFTTKENGTGLGLSVCQRIIHDIGGAIRVSTKGFGSTFSIVLPYSEQ
jgi:two-component system, sporulation sensor kinase E